MITNTCLGANYKSFKTFKSFFRDIYEVNIPDQKIIENQENNERHFKRIFSENKSKHENKSEIIPGVSLSKNIEIRLKEEKLYNIRKISGSKSNSILNNYVDTYFNAMNGILTPVEKVKR